MISRCLAAMPNACLLSEINPRSIKNSNPLHQAAQWYGLVSREEADAFKFDSDTAFCDAIELLLNRCADQGKTLLLRDWSHADFHAFPFLPNRTDRLSLRDVLSTRFEVNSVATVRHPLSHFLSMQHLEPLQPQWDDTLVLRGIRRFADVIDNIPWFRYEDFITHPDAVLCRMTEVLGLEFDPGYAERWWRGENITGNGTRQDGTIRWPKLKPCPDRLWNVFAASEDFRIAIERFGYRMPWKLRRSSCLPCDAEHDDSASREKGIAALNAGDFNAAARLLEMHLATKPVDDAALISLADALTKLQHWDEALFRLTEILERNSDNTDALERIVVCLEKLDRRFESIVYYRRLIARRPWAHHQRFQLAVHLHGIGALDESIFHCHYLLRAGYCIDGVISDYLLFLNYSDRHNAAEIAKEHFRIGMHFARQARVVNQRPLRNGSDEPGGHSHRKLRVGYLSKDFYVHPVGKLMVPILESHDRERVDVYVYHDGEKHDPMTKRAETAAMLFRKTHGKPAHEMEQLLQDDQLDVLVDLGGYTGGGNRIRLFSARCAPLQVAFLGYPATAAVPAIDFRITDRYADPPGLADGFYSERSLYLESGFLAYQPPTWIDDVNATG
ncbi:MAG: tetratricopeptide repeat protein [Pirellulaceae bacterium]